MTLTLVPSGPRGTLITSTLGGRTFKSTRRTAAHLEWTIGEHKRLFPRLADQFHIMQTCYHTGYAPSAGTHDFDAVFDFGNCGLPWLDSELFFRNHGWGDWWRHTGEWAAPADQHNHAISLPPGLKFFQTVGVFIDGGLSTRGKVVTSSQIVDYENHAEGLIGEHTPGIDHTPFPKDISAAIFDMRAYFAGRAASPWAAAHDLAHPHHPTFKRPRAA